MDFNLNKSILGKQASTPERYDASLLFRIPREENRVRYNIDSDNLPFVGVDVWNCYEVSFLTNNGLPVSRVLKLVYPSDSEFLVESKSLKLYLNSFNMEPMGKTIDEASEKTLKTISKDLKALLETEVKAVFFDNDSIYRTPFESFNNKSLIKLIDKDFLDNLKFFHFNESPELLKCGDGDDLETYEFHTDLLRSNCRVTNQPDWGDLFVKIETTKKIDLSSIIQYLVSFRKENHFHEEVVEMIFKRFYDIFRPEKLVVAAMYTRRGGIDINPVRATHAELIDEAFTSLDSRLGKTLRQ